MAMSAVTSGSSYGRNNTGGAGEEEAAARCRLGRGNGQEGAGEGRGALASAHLRFLGEAYHRHHARHFFFVDLASVGGVVCHEELYRLLYGRVNDTAGVAILLFQHQQPKEKKQQQAQPTENGVHKRGAVAQPMDKTAGRENRKNTKDAKLSKRSETAFEERCGGCKKPISIHTTDETVVDDMEKDQKTQHSRMWIRSYNSPKYLMSFAATFLVDRVMKDTDEATSAVHLYFVSNDCKGGIQQLTRQLKSMARVMTSLRLDEGSGYQKGVNYHQLRIDAAGVWAKRKHAEMLRELGLVRSTRVNCDVTKPSTSTCGDKRWERLSPFSLFDTAQSAPKTDGAEDARQIRKEKDIHAVVRRVKYYLWAEHERGIILPRTRRDLRKKLRPLSMIEKRLDALAIFGLLEASHLIRVCPICNECTFTFERYHDTLRKRKEVKSAKQAAQRRDRGASIRVSGAEDGSSEDGDGSELWDSGAHQARVDDTHQRRADKRQCFTKEERTRHVARTITQTLLKAKKEDRPNGRGALLQYIKNLATYKSHLDTDLVIAHLVRSGFVICENKTDTSDDVSTQQGYYSAAATSGREDAAVEYNLVLSDFEKSESAREEAERVKQRNLKEEAEAAKQQATYHSETRKKQKRARRQFDNLDNLKIETPDVDVWGTPLRLTDSELEQQKRNIAKRNTKTEQGAYIGYLMNEMKDEACAYTDEVCDEIEKYGVGENVRRGFYSYGFEELTVLQSKALGVSQSKRDALLLGASGSGKTVAYVLPLLNMIDYARPEPQVIVILPTRPLAKQVASVIEAIANFTNIKCVVLTGGNSVRQDLQAVKDAHVVIGTSGRIFDMINRSALSTDSLKLLVLDEVDDMLSQSKRDAIYDIFQKLPRNIQVYAVDTAISQDSFSILKKALKKTAAIITDDVVLASPYPSGVKHYTVDVGSEVRKLLVLAQMLGYGTKDPVERDLVMQVTGASGLDSCGEDTTSAGEIDGIVQGVLFCNSKRKVDWLVDKVQQLGFPMSALHEDLDPTTVQTIVQNFREGSIRLLATTDSMSFGIDVTAVNCVVNYDAPRTAKAYLRRVGRAGRFGRRGAAVTLLTTEEGQTFELLQKALPFDSDPLPPRLVL